MTYIMKHFGFLRFSPSHTEPLCVQHTLNPPSHTCAVGGPGNWHEHEAHAAGRIVSKSFISDLPAFHPSDCGRLTCQSISGIHSHVFGALATTDEELPRVAMALATTVFSKTDEELTPGISIIHKEHSTYEKNQLKLD